MVKNVILGVFRAPKWPECRSYPNLRGRFFRAPELTYFWVQLGAPKKGPFFDHFLFKMLIMYFDDIVSNFFGQSTF